jgi:hypothetical protein
MSLNLELLNLIEYLKVIFFVFFLNFFLTFVLHIYFKSQVLILLQYLVNNYIR